jgi:predicted regulator of Ras-like GTPase activity (Roadblock/LC7/MglB family)
MAIEGNLQDMSLVDIIQLYCRNREESQVTLTSDGREGAIYFREGQVAHATCEGEGGEEALYEMLGWTDGRFVIEKGASTPERTVHIPWTMLLMQGLQRLDEARGLERGEEGATGDSDLLAELAERIEGFVAAYVVSRDGTLRASYVVEEAFDVQRAASALAKTADTVRDLLAVTEAGGLEEGITLTARYRLVHRPIPSSEGYLQVALHREGNLGAARMYVSAYLATQGEALRALEGGGG